MEIRQSANKHGVSNDDIRHATTHAIAALTVPEQPEFMMFIGPDMTGRLLEIGVLDADDTTT